MKTPKSPEVKYRRQLDLLVKSLISQTRQNIIPLLKTFESEYVNDSIINDAYAQTLEQAFDNLRRAYVGIEVNAKEVSNEFVQGVDNVNKKRFYSAINNAIGIDLQSVIQNEGIEDALIATTRENIGLIKSIPDEYFKKLETMVFTGTTQGNTARSMIKQIVDLGHSTTKRAKLIARDQTSKLNSALNQQRQQNLGIEKYIWRTSEDERVRETHKRNDGKTFAWNDPPPTGHPGEEIQCRCVAIPVIEL